MHPAEKHPINLHPPEEQPPNHSVGSCDKPAPVLPGKVQQHNLGSHEVDPSRNPSANFSKLSCANSPKQVVPGSSSEEFCTGTSFAKDVAADPKNKNKKVFRDGPVVIELFAGSGRLTA